MIKNLTFLVVGVVAIINIAAYGSDKQAPKEKSYPVYNQEVISLPPINCQEESKAFKELCVEIKKDTKQCERARVLIFMRLTPITEKQEIWDWLFSDLPFVPPMPYTIPECQGI